MGALRSITLLRARAQARTSASACCTPCAPTLASALKIFGLRPRPSRQDAVGPAGCKEGASPTCAPITDRSARHQLREIKSSRRHLSPSHHHQRSPKRSRGHSPAPSLERSSTRSYARSPARSRAYPPARHSPARHSLARSHACAPAHARHHSRPYDRLSPTRERSPTGRSPTRYCATSPARETVFTSSPGRGTAPARVGHTDRKDSQQDASPGRRSQDSPPRKRKTTEEQGRSAERSRQSSLSFQEGPVVTTPKDEFISSSGDSSDSENSPLAPRGEFPPDRGEVAREEVPPRASVLESYFPSRRESKDTKTVPKSSSRIRQKPAIPREDIHVSPQEDLLGMGDLAASPPKGEHSDSEHAFWQVLGLMRELNKIKDPETAPHEGKDSVLDEVFGVQKPPRLVWLCPGRKG
ncbi:serine/arginine repetitive matrix protein 1-like [Palaemon carinicauda]|uniref:serine/arginine repetitive matrix protein 1-like n=1 Tax=Palaemon carinicauda TaxID=392227 RepID=UPI0035B6246A